MKKSIYLIILLIILILGTDRFFIGRKIDSYMDVPVYYNGLIFYKSYGKNYSKDGYYYGRKWQCVEYVKRFYYEKMGVQIIYRMLLVFVFYLCESSAFVGWAWRHTEFIDSE